MRDFEKFPERELKLMSTAFQRAWRSCCHRFLMDHSVPEEAVQVVRGQMESFDPYKQELDRRKVEAEMSLVEKNAEVAVGN